jgi:hypothetical protein
MKMIFEYVVRMMVGESDDDELGVLSKIIGAAPSISNDDWGDCLYSFASQGLSIYYSKSQKRYPIAVFRVKEIDLPNWKEGPYDADFPAGILSSDSRDAVQGKLGCIKASCSGTVLIGKRGLKSKTYEDTYEYNSLELKFAFDSISGEMLFMCLTYRP